MKRLFIIVVLLPLLSFSQVEVKEFDMVYLNAKKEKVTDVRPANTKVTIFEKSISVRYLNGLFIFEIVAEIPNDRNVTMLVVKSQGDTDITVTYDKNNTVMSFDYSDRMVMFYNSDKIKGFLEFNNN